MNLLDLAVVITCADKASDKVAGVENKIKSGLGTAAKVAGAAVVQGVANAASALVGFGVDSVRVGSQFDASMSQVAATMGVTTDEVQNLRDYALEMGSTTAFSASQAAEA